MLLDELHRFHCDAVRDVLIFPQRLFASFHVSDARDAIDNCLIVSVIRTRLEFGQQFRMILAERFAGKRLFVAHLNRVGRIQIHHPLIFKPYAGHAVARRRHDIGIIETDVLRPWGNKPVPILSGSRVCQP